MSQVYLGIVVKVQKGNPKKDNPETITVEKNTRRSHPKYIKTINLKKKYHVHNESFSLQVGDKVLFKSSRPYSKTKKFLITEKKVKNKVN